MPLAAGDEFGLTEILAPFGAGCRGESYKGRDTRLGDCHRQATAATMTNHARYNG
jgi:hypothetical protein